MIGHGFWSRLSARRQGVLWILLSAALFSGMDALAKTLALTYPLPQVIWARYPASVVLILVLLRGRAPEVVLTRRPGLQIVRGLLVLGTLSLHFTGLHFIPLADAMAILFVTPIVVTALSFPLLGERVGGWLWASVLFGFAGALIIIRPGFGVVQLAAFLPLAAACTYALYQIAGRVLSRSDRAMTTLVHTTWVGALVSSCVVPFYWRTPDLVGWVQIGALGAVAGLGQFALIKAFEAAPVAAVTSFTYSGLLWATLLGYLVFGDLPDRWTVIGAAVIVTSGLYILYREHREVHARASESPP